MPHTIRGFRADKAILLQAILLQDTIQKYDPSTLATVQRIESLMMKHGIVSDKTHWEKVELVLSDLGYDYDEIFEVISR